MAVWVVAVEYDGDDLAVGSPGRRRPVLEHAYDTTTGRFAHGERPVRVGFPRPVRGWPAAPVVTRCPACALAVTELITGLVAEVVGRTATEFTRWAIDFTRLVQDDVALWAVPPQAAGEARPGGEGPSTA